MLESIVSNLFVLIRPRSLRRFSGRDDSSTRGFTDLLDDGVDRYLGLGSRSAYYQTTWFAAVSLVAVLALVWAAHRIRLGIVEKHQREITALNERLMNAQEQGRIRIAGELHDGVGFERSRLGTSRGVGLITMRERASQLNGTFDVDSVPGRGTTIRVAVPFR